jgi:transposase InsO family protein
MTRAHFNRFGFSIRRVLTDNGSCYKHWLFRKTLCHQHVKHRFTRPYTPRTNGKAERFIQTALREWAYARSYQNSAEREEQLEYWLHDYNFHRPHVSLKLQTPASRAGLNRNNLLSLHS